MMAESGKTDGMSVSLMPSLTNSFVFSSICSTCWRMSWTHTAQQALQSTFP